MTEKLRAAIIGSTGYGGVELIRLLLRHPLVDITSVISSSTAGTPIAEGFPHLSVIMRDDLDPVDMDLIKDKADVVFAATPSGVSAKLVPQLVDTGLKVIDLSGDFRIRSRTAYTEWYKREAAEQAYLERAVYGLAEIYRDRVRNANFISNPGCYATAALLGTLPALTSRWIDPTTLIIDAKSGVSGAGRGLSLNVHYAEINENFKAYKVNKHQHIPEIEQVLTDELGEPVTTTFTTHLVPMTRGIMCTIYAQLTESRQDAEFIELYEQFYEGKPFVRVRPQGIVPATKEVWGSNYCDIGFSVDPRTKRVTIFSVIDNVVKGAAGQAVQNLNLMMGWEEGLGLDFTPVYP